MVVSPDINVRPRDGGISTVSAARRRIGVVGLSALGSAAQRLHTSDPDAVVGTFGSGQLVELACHGLRNSKEAVALDICRINPSISGYAMDVTATRAGSPPSGGLMTVAGAPNDSYEVRVRMTAESNGVEDADAEFQLSLDGGDSYGNRIAIPITGIYAIPGTGLTLTFDTAGGGYVVGDAFSFDCVGPGFSSVDLGNALTALDSDGYRYSKLYVVGTGATAAASAALAATVLSHAEAREAAKHFMRSVVQAKHGLINGPVTLGGTPTATEEITLSGTPAQPQWQFKIEILGTGARGVGTFRYSLDNGTTWVAGSPITITAGTGINVLGTTGVTVTFAAASYTDGNEYTWVPVEETDAQVDAAFASVSGWRISVAAGDVEIESSLNKGRKNRRGVIYSAFLKDCENPLKNDMGRVKDGVLRGVTALYRDENATPGLDEKKFIVAGTYEGSPGKFYIYNGNTRAADGSVFDLTQYVDIVNEACRITQVFLNDYPGEDLRTNDDGTILAEEAEAIDDQLASLLEAGLGADGAVQRLSVRVRRDLSLASTRKLSARVTMVPPFYVKQAEADVGFAVSLTAA